MASSSDRFEFGANWARFLRRLTGERITLAEHALTDWLGDLRGRSFLDIGSGSGLHSLAARNLGAQVRSFDYDPESVACTAELRRRFHPGDPSWIVEQGSVLDRAYLASLGPFDVVCSWGVLHHTGDLWRALDLATVPLAPEGRLFLALYNRTPDRQHRIICAMKRTYNRVPKPLRWLMLGGYAMFDLAFHASIGRTPAAHIRSYRLTSRGMSWWTDIVDWVGGYPYEPTTPAEVVAFYRDRGFNLARQLTPPGHGCNEFLLSRSA
jgi:SAM-dependent methyltransferase